MKRSIFIFLLCSLFNGLFACQDEDHTVPVFPSDDQETEDPAVEFYDWEENRSEILSSTDMVLRLPLPLQIGRASCRERV